MGSDRTFGHLCNSRNLWLKNPKFYRGRPRPPSRLAWPRRPRKIPGRMNNQIRWLARLGIDQNLFRRAQCVKINKELGEAATLLDFAQKLVDDDVVADVDVLEKLVNLANSKGKLGAPAEDPFLEVDHGLAPLVMPTPAERAKEQAAKTKEKDVKPGGTGPVPTFAFETVAAMDDQAVAASVRELLKATARHRASDLHLTTGRRPFMRKDRAITFLSEHVLTPEDALRLNTALLSEGQKKIFTERKDYDYALALSGSDRYRVNLMVHKNGAAGSYRMVPDQIKTMAELGFSAHVDTIKKLLSYHNGLILITGPVGSGKTTTLASMVAYLNETRTDHIITVEDPIEVVQAAKGCNVTQREVGPHTKSFFTALKGALREDPDIIVIGELRDLETIEMAITASETGHLVIGTMHTSDAATTLNRMLDVFPPAQQAQIRASVAESLRGIVCQRLLPANAGGLTLACEILINNTAISALIREGKSQGLRNTMETGVREGMCLMDNVIFQLYNERKISGATALGSISNRVLRAKITP